MARQDIWKDGLKTQFSANNQPAGRGRPKGKSKKTQVAQWLGAMMTAMMKMEEQQEKHRRKQRNARRRELYRERQQPDNDCGLPNVSFPAMARMDNPEKCNP